MYRVTRLNICKCNLFAYISYNIFILSRTRFGTKIKYLEMGHKI